MGASPSSCSYSCGDCKHGTIKVVGEPMDQVVYPEGPPECYSHSEASASIVPSAFTAGAAAHATAHTAEADLAGGRDDVSEDLAASSDAGGLRPEAQEVIAKFVQNLVKGRSIEALMTSGGTLECIVSVDREVKSLSISKDRKDAKKRTMLLRDIERIIVGPDVPDVDLPLDDDSVTLMMEDGQAIAFRFPDMEERDTFALCLGLFVDARRAEAERKKKRKQRA